MTMKQNEESAKRSPRAAERLAELTGRPVEDFDASDYPIPDFEDQELIVDDE